MEHTAVALPTVRGRKPRVKPDWSSPTVFGVEVCADVFERLDDACIKEAYEVRSGFWYVYIDLAASEARNAGRIS